MTPNTLRLGRRDDRNRMVVGFAFRGDRKQVALIAKEHEPSGADMIGTFNGIGGKCKPRESYHRAMVREFMQEAGVLISPWDLFAIIEGDYWRLFCYTADCDDEEWRQIKTLGRSETDEMVVRISTRAVILDSVPKRYAQLKDVEGLSIDRQFYSDVPTLVQLALSSLYEFSAIHIDRRSL